MTATNAYVLPTGDYGEPLPASPIDLLAGGPKPGARKAESAQEYHDALRGIKTMPLAPQTLPRLPTPEDTRPHLTSRPLLSMGDVLLMGSIRNTCRAGFSHDTTPIDDRRQQDWWRWNHNRVVGYLYDDQAGNTVGYGCLLQREDGTWVSSVAVLPQFGGRGYGKAITSHLVLSVEHEVYARARTDNPAAMKLHDPLIWEVTGVDQEGANCYYRTWPKIRAARLAMNLDHCEKLGQ